MKLLVSGGGLVAVAEIAPELLTEDKYIVWFSISFCHTPNATIRVGPYVAAPCT